MKRFFRKNRILLLAICAVFLCGMVFFSQRAGLFSDSREFLQTQSTKMQTGDQQTENQQTDNQQTGDQQTDNHQTANQSSFLVEFADVGQGDCALIECDGHSMLIDGGSRRASAIVYTMLKEKGISKLDYMVATHPDEDHIGGLSGALHYASADICFSPVKEYDSESFANLLQYLGDEGKTVTVPAEYQTFDLGTAKVELFCPDPEAEEINNRSIITKVTYGKNVFLFMGDAEEEEEMAFLSAQEDVTCDVLKVGHHGSASSTTAEFLRKVKPETAILSVGAGNDYGHPTERTLQRLRDAGAEICRTDLEGNIIFTSDGQDVMITVDKQASEETLWTPGNAGPVQNMETDSVSGPDSSPAAENDGVSETGSANENDAAEITYVLNVNSNKFHRPTCPSVKDISSWNRIDYSGTREDVIEMGYTPCNRCDP